MSPQLKFVLYNYGFLCPKNREVTTSEFIEYIKKSYDCTDEKSVNQYACDVLEYTPAKKYYFEYTGNVEVRN